MTAKDDNGCVSANVPVIIPEPAAVPPPEITAITLSNTDVVLVWTSLPGLNYQVQYTRLT